jgi:YVTN family beta-propeller protein
MKTLPTSRNFAARYLAAAMLCAFSTGWLASSSHAAVGDVVAQYPFGASAMVMSPTEPYIYATIPSQNSVAIINTNTLAVENTVFVGSGPAGLTFSPDGRYAYIANSSSSFVVVFDTQTRSVVNSFLMPQQPRDVVFASGNRLFVLSHSTIYQIDATTGASVGENISSGAVLVYSGALEISPDGNALYYGNYGVSPAKMYKFNVTTTTPVLQWGSPHGPHGDNGQDLTLSHDGSFISYAVGSGQNLYQIAKFRTSDMGMLGSFNTGAYPQQIAFSPDDRIAYAVHTAGEIDLFDALTFLPIGTIRASGEATELTVDRTGRYLFASYNAQYSNFTGTRVFDTGRVVPSSVASRRLHGAAGEFDIPLPVSGASGSEPRSGGATGDYTLVVTFFGEVAVNGTPQAHIASGTGTVGTGGTSNGGAVSVSGNTVTIPLTNVGNAQRLDVQLNGVAVGGTTRTATIALPVLVGDTTGDRSVNASDVSQTKSQSGAAVTAENFRIDVVANGTINASDIGLVKSRSGTMIFTQAPEQTRSAR